MLAAQALEGPTIRLEPLGPHHIDGLCAVGLDPELWRLTVSARRRKGSFGATW